MMRGWLALALVALTGACSASPTITDRGFEGTWARTGAIGGYRSIVSILRDDDRWLFRWKIDTEDGKWKVRCDWEGRCEEFVDGKRTGSYTFRVTQDSRADVLIVDCVRVSHREGDAGYHYVDELVLAPGGREITAYTLELDGRAFTREATRALRLEKISDAVADPPPGIKS